MLREDSANKVEFRDFAAIEEHVVSVMAKEAQRIKRKENSVFHKLRNAASSLF